MSNVLATIVLHYEGNASSASGNCTVEHDEILDTIVDSNGEVVEKTSFLPGDIYHFLVKCTGKLRVSRIRSTTGDIISLGGVSRTRGNELLFVELNSADNKPSLSYPPTGGVSAEWIGNVGGPLIVDSVEQKVDISSGEIPCYCKSSYSVSFESYRMVHNALDQDEYTIYIVVYLEEIP